MKRNQLLLCAGLCAAGLPSGYLAKRLSSPPPPAAAGSEPADGTVSRFPGGKVGPVSAATQAVLKSVAQSSLRSTDTLESVKSLAPEDLYGWLALWMVDASEQDIAAYWQHYRQQEKRENEINDLIFINWTRVNPQAATAAAKGTPDEHYAWWAWACHDPKGSLAAVLASNPDRLNNVTWGIGEFHHDWLREHFDEIPEAGRNNALSGMAKWDDGENPLETLEFLKEKGRGFHQGIFKVLVRKDPWAAYDWIQQNPRSDRDPFSGFGDTMGTFVETMSEQHPDVLERIADQAPSGELKRKMEAALFASLLKSDPEAAIEQAKTTAAPVIAAQRLATVGLSLIQSDPERAFELAESLFAAGPDVLNGMTRVDYPGGSSGWGSGNQEVNQLMDALIMKDPDRVMEMNISKLQDEQSGSTFSQLAGKWAAQDIAAYSAWVNGQSDPKVRLPATVAVIDHLQGTQQYADAVEWAMSLEQSRDGHLRGLFYRWTQVNPDEARTWLETADLSENEAAQLKNSLPARQ